MQNAQHPVFALYETVVKDWLPAQWARQPTVEKMKQTARKCQGFFQLINRRGKRQWYNQLPEMYKMKFLQGVKGRGWAQAI